MMLSIFAWSRRLYRIRFGEWKKNLQCFLRLLSEETFAQGTHSGLDLSPWMVHKEGRLGQPSVLNTTAGKPLLLDAYQNSPFMDWPSSVSIMPSPNRRKFLEQIACAVSRIDHASARRRMAT